jgi:hypothetical protein
MKKNFKKIFNQNFFLPSNIFSRAKLLFFWEYCYLRFIYYFIIKRNFKSLQIKKENSNIAGYDYSKRSFYDGNIPIYRPDSRIFYPFFNLISNPNLNKDSLLIVGPRYENEIFLAKVFGFKKIVAIDIFSYSPLVLLQDMHNLDFPDNSFDNIIVGWTLSYSLNPTKAASEFTRILKKSGLIILTVSKVLDEKTFKESHDKIKGILGKENRVQSLESFNSLFPDLECICCFEDTTHNIQTESQDKGGGPSERQSGKDSQFLITYKKK